MGRGREGPPKRADYVPGTWEILERFFMSVLWFTLIWLCLSKLVMDALLRFVMKPLDPISNGTRLTVQPAAFISSYSPLYLEPFSM